MAYTAEEYRQIMINVFDAAIHDIDGSNCFEEHEKELVIQGLEIGRTKLENSEFLTKD